MIKINRLINKSICKEGGALRQEYYHTGSRAERGKAGLIVPLCGFIVAPLLFTGVLLVCMSVHHVPAWFLERPEKASGSSELELTDSCMSP